MPMVPQFTDGNILSGAMLNNIAIDAGQIQSGTWTASYLRDNIVFYDDFIQYRSTDTVGATSPGVYKNAGTAPTFVFAATSPTQYSGLGWIQLQPAPVAGTSSIFGTDAYPLYVVNNAKFYTAMVDQTAATNQILGGTSARAMWGFWGGGMNPALSGTGTPILTVAGASQGAAAFVRAGGSFFTHTDNAGVGSTEIKIVTGSPLPGSYAVYGIEFSTGSVVFSKDGSTLSVHTTNIPNTVGQGLILTMQTHTLDTNTRTMYCDFIAFEKQRR